MSTGTPEKKPPRSTLTPAQARLTGSLGGHTSWARTKDRSARTAPGRAASPPSDSYWEQQVDPAGEMSDSDRRKAAQNAKKAHYQRMAWKSAQVRQARKAAREAAQQQARKTGAS
ncbi:hypothetical protein [Mycobacterium sp. 852002-51057_SCH5723018]|uniref:hypothetical protein n=1 Tax=Mycobacterium sp. 852002-51057_SCH5723018 TaxID=1834094 RepID=UPI0009EDD7F9|nr:hypothetical protein [Mycobacterium sp. 852002-51057_SCH5723018]